MRKWKLLLFSIAILSFSIYLFFSPILYKSVFSDKIWVHRVNSIEKLNEVKNHFSGVELDIEFVESLNLFDVNHYPAKSIGLSLKDYFLNGANNKKLFYWLDFKNLNSKNQHKSLKLLNEITDELGINRNNIIVENAENLLLADFNNNGYQTSFYLHWPGLFTLNQTSLNKELIRIKKNMETNQVTNFISSDYRDYELLKHHFPKKEKLVWLDAHFFNSFLLSNRIKLYEMLSDDKVKVVLIKHQTETEER
jgi:hypothetical protein